MPSKKSRTESEVLQYFRGGKGLREDLVRRYISEFQKKKNAQVQKRGTTEQQMAKYLTQVKGLAQAAAGDPQTAKALDGLLGIHKKLAKQKIAAPSVVRGPGGILPGRISVKVTPPFDYDEVIQTVLAGDQPVLSGSADKNTGQMSDSCMVAIHPGRSGGSMYTTVGIYFHPMTPGTLTVYANPTFSFQWWTNSIADYSPVRSAGAGALTIYGIDVVRETTTGLSGIDVVAGTQFFMWEEDQTSQVRFDAGFDLQASVSVQTPVDQTLVYLLFVEAFTHVEGMGWPGSLAGAIMSVTVPSISYDFEIQPVLHP
jgi:hypothetical protein